MNAELLRTINGRASLVEMHATAIRRMADELAWPSWQTKAEADLIEAERQIVKALQTVQSLRRHITDCRSEAA